MNKKILGSSLATFAIATAFLWGAGGDAQATLPGGPVMYQVKVTNITPNQILSPVLVATHNRSISLFQLGQPAIDELATLAESGMNGDLADLLNASADVCDVVSGAGPIMPGASEVLIVEGGADGPLLSLASMLVTTNDAFAAVTNFSLPLTRRDRVRGVAYDAGSEFNSEECAYIPGPPCGGQAHDPREPEGFVHVSSGVHGVGDLAEAEADWRNPVIDVTVLRLN